LVHRRERSYGANSQYARDASSRDHDISTHLSTPDGAKFANKIQGPMNIWSHIEVRD
jgi:hypothetical protein